jgi:hypothetical protein
MLRAALSPPHVTDGFEDHFCRGVVALAARFGAVEARKVENRPAGCLRNNLRAKSN